MKTILCLLKTYPINFTNLFLAGICHSHGNILGPCQYRVSTQGFFDTDIGSTARVLSPIDPSTSFRRLSWSDPKLLSILDNLIDQCKDRHKILCFGSHQTENLELLKSRYGDQSLTIGLSYQQDLYPLLLDNLARYHVFLLERGLISPNQSDLDHMRDLEKPALIEHFRCEFDRMELIEKQSVINLDYNLDMRDFLDIDCLTGHYVNLGFDNAKRFRQYCSTWHHRYKLV
jgi:hypothetical protein